MGGEQRVLDRVGGVLGVAQGPQRDGPQPVAAPADQLAEGIRVAGDVPAQQGGVLGVPLPLGQGRKSRLATPSRKPRSLLGSRRIHSSQ